MQLLLRDRPTAKRIRTKVDLFTGIVDPNDRVSVFTNPNLSKVCCILKVGEDSTPLDHGPQVDDTHIAVTPFEFEHAMDDRLRR